MNRKKFILSNFLLLAGINVKLHTLPLMLKENNPYEDIKIDFIGNTSTFLQYKEIIKNIPGVNLQNIQDANIISANTKAVIISNNDKNTSNMAEAILKQGKHILLNLPSDYSFQDFSRIQLQANLQNLRVGIISPFRNLEAVIMARKYLRTNTLGEIESYDIHLSPEICKQETGIIGFGSHLINLIIFLTHDSPYSINANSDSIQNSNNTNTTLSFTAKLKNADINYEIENRDNKSDWQININGNKGSVEIHSDNTTIFKDLTGKENIVFKGKVEDIDNATRILLTDFIMSCQNGKEPEVNFTEALQSILINQAVINSLTTAESIQLIETSYPNNNEQYLFNL